MHRPPTTETPESASPTLARPAATRVGVLFDMDGTLVDTEPFWHAAQIELAQQCDVDWTMDDAHAWTGRSMPELAVAMRERGIPLSDHDIMDRLVALVVRRTDISIPWLPGARELLTAVSALQIPAAIVTNAGRDNAEGVLRHAPAGSLAFALSKDDVPVGKPDPTPYVLGAERLGINPAGSIAFEDSAAGAQSAYAAGLAVWFIASHTSDPGVPVDRILPSIDVVTAREIAERLGLDVDDPVAD